MFVSLRENDLINEIFFAMYEENQTKGYQVQKIISQFFMTMRRRGLTEWKAKTNQ